MISARNPDQLLYRLARRLSGGWLCAVMACLFLAGWPAAASAAEYHLKTWTVENGLPQNVIRGIAQTPDGYLWIATLDGLARFDGVRFTTFNKSNATGIASNRFSRMVQDRSGDLWLSTESGGLTRYHGGTFHSFGPEDGIPAGSVRAVLRASAGGIWVLSEDSILRFNPQTSDFMDVTPADAKVRYQPLVWDSAGFWAQDSTGLHLFIDGRFTSYPLPAWLSEKPLWGVGRDQGGGLWLEAADGRQGIIPPGSQTVKPVDTKHPQTTPYVDSNGRQWTIRISGRLSRQLEVQSSGHIAIIPMTRVFEDKEGNVWIGTEGDGLYQLREETITVYSKAQGLIDKGAYPIYQDKSGTIWIGAWNLGLSSFRDGRFTNYSVAQGLPAPLVSALGGDRDGNLWVGTHGDLAVFRNETFHTPDVFLPEHSVVHAILQDRGGTLWLGTTNGLVAYRNGQSRIITEQDGLASNDVKIIIESASGDLWVGGFGGLTRIHGSQFTHWTERDGLPSDNIRSLYEDADGVLWIGTYDGGLGRFKNGQFTRYSEHNGLFNNGVFQVLEDGRGNLWMSSNRGIYRVSKNDLNAVANGRQTSITSVAYGKADGMLNEECNGGMAPAGIKTKDGKLWFPTQDGVAVIDPGTVWINHQSPPVMIESALVERVPANIQNVLRIPPGKENLEIEYTALSFVRSEQIRFRYKLDGLDSNWIDAGARRTAYYSHLPPGTYTFHVIAANSDGVWNTDGQSLTITVQAPFYRTWWFIAIVALFIAALIALAVYYRISQLKHTQALQKAFSQQLIASQESERQRIASELHDSLGQRLLVINNLLKLVLGKQNKGIAPSQETMQEISGETSLAIQETREISYNLRPFQLDRLGLTKAIEIVGRTVSSASRIPIECDLDNIDDALPENLRINFYRIVQESLNNVMKHSQATEVTIRIIRNDERIVLTVRDNGVGFMPTNHPSKGGKSGFGLTGMAERAHSLGGVFRFRSAPTQGTTMTVEIPIDNR
ncbi:sensor histidine kinase [Terracidiphilus sp.]|jgi:signal transduction histidine kinase/ligand-binding sensor domain-containing protein|uniref:sensor histidine kinase n=1 Tax=Terracidiphilus sp. TaxID=1964191 RepID=UPI003C21C405